MNPQLARLTAAEAEELIEELQQQAAHLEEQTAELELLNDEIAASEARVRGIVDSALDAVVVTDAQSVILEWSRSAESVFGWSQEEALGRCLNETIIPVQHREGHQRGVEHYLATGEGPILSRRIEITALRRSGEEFPVELTVVPVRWAGHLIFTSFIRDITELKRVQRQNAAQHAVTRVLARAQTLDEAIPQFLSAVCESLGWDMAVFWAVDPERDVLRSSHVVSSAAIQGRDFEAVSREMEFAAGVGLPGRVWASGDAVWVEDVTQDTNFPRLAVAARVGLHAAFAFPIRAGDEFLGVMEFFQRSVAEPDPDLLVAMREIASDVAQFTLRKRAEVELRKREEVQRFIAEVSERLASSTPDYEQTLRRLALLAVPVLGDWCTVYLADGDGAIQRLEIAHADPTKDPIVQALDRYPVDPEGAHPANQVLKTGEPVLITEIADALIDAIAQDAEHARLIRALGLKSAMIVPLRARGHILGTVTLIAADSGRRYGPDDLQVAVEFAHRAALAVDNARLFAESERANRAKAEFLSTMSHELRTPLNAMIGYTSLLEQGIPTAIPDAALEYVRRVGLSAHHLLQLIEEILTFSRLEAGREVLAIETVGLAQLVSEVRAILEPLAREKGIGFHVQAPERRVAMRTDARKVRQILMNLLGNAIKFTATGEVEFTASADEDHVVFRVRDTGIGIAPENLARITEPFWQEQRGPTRGAEGTGLGLTITDRLTRLLGGRLDVESTPGQGSLFTVTLPIGVAPATGSGGSSR